MIAENCRERLHSYLGGIVRGLGGVPLAIGGVADHVHLLVGLKTSHRLDYFTRDLKADSSKWVHEEVGRRLFAWQKGYAVFSVSPSYIESVRRYILDQENHHRRRSFQEEYITLLKESGIEYDERFVW